MSLLIYLYGKFFFLQNCIIATLSQAMIIIKTMMKDGAMITVKYTNMYNRDVFALPGSVRDPYSAGCNHLIKKHQTYLIISVQEMDYLLNW
ncbi:MAG: DNA-processing protein DprA [Flavobacteriales bacterium AspAUS03]